MRRSLALQALASVAAENLDRFDRLRQVKLLDPQDNKLGRKKNPARRFFSASGAWMLTNMDQKYSFNPS
jgi:hypothetical protein